MKKILGIVFLFALSWAGFCPGIRPQDRIATTKDQYEEITKEIQEHKKQEEELSQEERMLLDHLDRLALALDGKSGDLRVLETEISQTEKAIATLEVEIGELQGRISTTRKQVETRIGALYRISKVEPWSFLLSSRSYGDLLRMFTFLSTMIHDDMQGLARYQEQLEQKEAFQEKLNSYRRELREEQIEASLKKQEIEAIERSKERTLKKVQASRASFSRVIQDLEQQAQKLQSLIKELSTPRQTISSQKNPGFGALKGKLSIPVAGGIVVSGPKGLRGISLKAPAGTPVLAVCAGRIVYAGWFKGYGNLLIIDHGDKFHTVMGNASELLKKEDDWVKTGEPVAKVGSSGSLDGPSLYFEIRQGGIPVNSMEWFSPQDQTALK